MKQPTQKPSIATKDATATIIVNVYANALIPATYPIKPNNKQKLAILELKRCWSMSSGMYCDGSFFRNPFEK